MSGESNQVVWRGVRPVEGIAGVWPARNALRINEWKTQGSAGLWDLYTVPANKKLFISAVVLSSRLNVAGDERCFIAVRDDSNVRQYIMLYHNYNVIDMINTTMTFFPALEALAAWDVYLDNGSDDINVYYACHGWLEDA